MYKYSRDPPPPSHTHTHTLGYWWVCWLCASFSCNKPAEAVNFWRREELLPARKRHDTNLWNVTSWLVLDLPSKSIRCLVLFGDFSNSPNLCDVTINIYVCFHSLSLPEHNRDILLCIFVVYLATSQNDTTTLCYCEPSI